MVFELGVIVRILDVNPHEHCHWPGGKSFDYRAALRCRILRCRLSSLINSRRLQYVSEPTMEVLRIRCQDDSGASALDSLIKGLYERTSAYEKCLLRGGYY